MADNSDSRESENNSWVIAGSEALAVEDLGLEMPADPLAEEQAPSKESHQASSGESGHRGKDPETEEAKPKEAEAEAPLPATQEAPILDETPKPGPVSSAPGKDPGSTDGEKPPAPVCPRAPVAVRELGPAVEEAATSSSGEDLGVGDRDVEGLRRRKVRDVAPAGPGASRNRKDGSLGDGDGESTKLLFGLLALMGLGLLVALGVVLDTDEAPVDILTPGPNSDGDEPHPATDGSHGPAPPASEPPIDAGPQQAKDDIQLPSEAPKGPQSLDAMGILLDKLAKENQDIRLMQAELQAQKEELRALLRKTEGEALEFTSQQQAMAAENARLVDALRREKEALLAVQAELRLLRDGLPSPAKARPGVDPGPDQPGSKLETQEAEIRRLRAALASAAREVAKASQRIQPGEDAEGLRSELSGVGQRLARESEADGPDPSWKAGAKRRKETAWRKRAESPEGFHHDRRERPRDHKSNRPPSPKKHPAHPEAKPDGVRKPKKPTEPGALWAALAKHPFRAPQGCAGVAECAHREGLEPVQHATFLPLVQRYLAGLGWAEHFGALAEALGGFFGHDGAFAHDRVSFVDFLDEAEDALEELARSLGRSREDPDDFEEVMLRQVGAAPGARFAHRPDGKERKSGPLGGKNGRDHRARG